MPHRETHTILPTNNNGFLLNSCTVQNSILCDRVVIENNCKLNDCNIGSGYKIVTGSKIKSESFSSASH